MARDAFKRASNKAARDKIIQRILERAKENGTYDEMKARIDRMEAVVEEPLTEREEQILAQARFDDEVGTSFAVRRFNARAQLEGRSDRLVDNRALEAAIERSKKKTITVQP